MYSFQTCACESTYMYAKMFPYFVYENNNNTDRPTIYSRVEIKKNNKVYHHIKIPFGFRAFFTLGYVIRYISCKKYSPRGGHHYGNQIYYYERAAVALINDHRDDDYCITILLFYYNISRDVIVCRAYI